jgi:hypothetical protein
MTHDPVFPTSIRLPLPPRSRAPRKVTLTVTDADQIRAASDARFPPNSPPARALHQALDDAERSRLVTAEVSVEDAIALRTVVTKSAPARVRAAHAAIISQLPPLIHHGAAVRVQLRVGHARTLHRHHAASRAYAAQSIRRLVERSDYESRTLTATLPWEAALLVDTLAILDPDDLALRRTQPDRTAVAA